VARIRNDDDANTAVNVEAIRMEYLEDIPELNISNVEIADETQVAVKGDPEANRLILTEEQVRQLGIMAEFGLSLDEMTQILGVCKSKATLSNRYGDVIEQGRARGNYMLRRRQYDIAMQGDVKMLVHLGKTRLGQRETTEVITKQILPWGNDIPDDLGE
jgi:hypothetical protein